MEHKHEIFIPHTKYYYSFVCDASSYVEIEVIKRTAKTVTIKDQYGEVSKRKIYHMDNVEYIKPCGTYSMNPICTAEKIVVDEPEEVVEQEPAREEIVEQLEICLEKIPFESVIYWKELKEIFNWARKKTFSSYFICWGAQAALYHHYGFDIFPM